TKDVDAVPSLAVWGNGPPCKYNTAAVIDCSGNLKTARFKQSNKSWCCSLTPKNGHIRLFGSRASQRPQRMEQSRCHKTRSGSGFKQRNDLQSGKMMTC